jgi:hypothetical protein
MDIAMNLDEKDGDQTVYLPMPKPVALTRQENIDKK